MSTSQKSGSSSSTGISSLSLITLKKVLSVLQNERLVELLKYLDSESDFGNDGMVDEGSDNTYQRPKHLFRGVILQDVLNIPIVIYYYYYSHCHLFFSLSVSF